MGVVSLNSCRKNRRRGRALLKELRSLDNDMIIFLQEVKTWQDRLDDGMRILSEVGKDCAIAVPSRWGEAVLDVEHGEFFLWHCLDRFRQDQFTFHTIEELSRSGRALSRR